MPTGYTAGVADGTLSDFRTFALQCARNFGATIMQRDEPTESLPRLREVSPFYAKERARAEARVAALRAMTPDEAERAAAAEYAQRTKEAQEFTARTAETRARYEAMLHAAEAWTPPTKEHEGLKTFMLDQLRESINFDCRGPWDAPQRLGGRAWFKRERERADRALVYAVEAEADEVRRVTESNAWITALYESLAPVASGEGR